MKNKDPVLQRMINEEAAMTKERLLAASQKSKQLKTGAPDVEGSNKDIKAYLKRVPVRRY